MKKTAIAVLVLAGIGLAATLNKPATVQPYTHIPSVPADVDAFLQQTEAAKDRQFGLVPGTEKRVRWFADEGERTPLAILYFPGFSATRQEIVPVTDIVADHFGANLLGTRWAGHGRERDGLREVTAEDWLADAAEALAIGAVIGERIAIISTSTGSTLALALLEHPLMANVDAIVMIAPNVVPMDPNSDALTWPGGPLLARMVIGSERSWEPKNAAQGRFWTTTWPLEAVIETMRLVQWTRANLPATVDQHLLTVASMDDSVVNTALSRSYTEAVAAPRNVLVEFTASADEHQHVVAGDIVSPEGTDEMIAIVVEFLSEQFTPPTVTSASQ